MKQSDIIYEITNPMSDTDPRVIAAFGAIFSPIGDEEFPKEVMSALQKFDWNALLEIAFSKPLNRQQSMAFMDTLNYTNTQIDIISFLNQTVKTPSLFIHKDFRKQFENESFKVSNIISKSSRGR